MKKKTIAAILACTAVLAGCRTKHVTINTALPFEKRYTPADTILVNGTRLEIPKGKTVWILTSDTLNNLLIYSDGSTLP